MPATRVHMLNFSFLTFQVYNITIINDKKAQALSTYPKYKLVLKLFILAIVIIVPITPEEYENPDKKGIRKDILISLSDFKRLKSFLSSNFFLM